MVVLDSLLEYSVVSVDESDSSTAYEVIKEYMINENQHRSLVERDERILISLITHYIKECRCFGLKNCEKLIGLVMVDDYNNNFISHIGISKLDTNSTGSGLLLNYILNIVFEDEDVYVKSKDISSFKSIIEPTNALDVFKIKDNARYVIRKLVKGE